MPLRDDILRPIAGDQPSGVDLRYASVYDKIKEARREDDDLAQGAWKHERKTADHTTVIRLAQDALATQSKDLQLAVWLTESLLKRDGFAGLAEGLHACRGLLSECWDGLFPPVEDGDLELRAAPLDWLGSRLDVPVRMTAINSAGHSLHGYKESRTVGYEEDAKDPNQKKTREKLIKEGKLAPEDFDKGFAETPKVFYAASEKALDASLAALKQLQPLCEERFGDAAPGFGRLRTALEEVRHQVHQFLEKKRETDPDPIEPVAMEPEALAVDGAGEPVEVPAFTFTLDLGDSQEPEDRRETVASIAAAAAFLRRREPKSPASFLMLRGLRWGELRVAAERGNAAALEAPPTEARRTIKRLAMEKRWRELLEAAETMLAYPYSRAWLDLQRQVVDACTALGPDYALIARAIRSELRALLTDVPSLMNATLMDDTPAANAETQKWLTAILEGEEAAANGFAGGCVDGPSRARAALKAGDHQKAFSLMNEEVNKQVTGRGRFLRQLDLVELCLMAGKDAIAQPILDDLIAQADAHRIEDWEDRAIVADALSLMMSASQRIQKDAKEKQKYFERICRLDPGRAFANGA